MRLLKTIRVTPRCAVKMYRLSETKEYIVKTVRDGSVEGGKDGGYFTEDKGDARATAAHEVKRLRRLRKSGAC